MWNPEQYPQNPLRRKYDYEYVSSTPSPARDEEQFGAVVVFPPGMSKEDAQKLIRRLMKAEPGISVDGPRAFNPDHGSPVWYIP